MTQEITRNKRKNDLGNQTELEIIEEQLNTTHNTSRNQKVRKTDEKKKKK